MLYAFQHNNRRTHKYMYSSGLNWEAECEVHLQYPKQRNVREGHFWACHDKLGIRLGECIKCGEAMVLPERNIYVLWNLLHPKQVPNLSRKISLAVAGFFQTYKYNYYKGMLEVHCRHRRYGTILFHKNCDLVSALSIALGKRQSPKIKQEQDEIHMIQNPHLLIIQWFLLQSTLTVSFMKEQRHKVTKFLDKGASLIHATNFSEFLYIHVWSYIQVLFVTVYN